MGRVINIKDGEKYDVYIGRKGRGHDGYFGNPFNTGTRTEKLNNFESYLKDRLEVDDDFRESVKQLHDKTLGCFCKPKPCHGDILLKHAKRLHIEDEIFNTEGDNK